MDTRKESGAMHDLWLKISDWIGLNATPARRRGARGGRRRPRLLQGLERLDDRMLLACDAWIDRNGNLDPKDDYLRVEGDGVANRIDIRFDGLQYIVDYDCNADGDYFDATDDQEAFDDFKVPGGISISGFGGADRITVDETVTVGVVIEGGEGNDSLTGGAGNDTIRGSSGGDSLWGRRGNDVLEGGSANDTLDGGLGADVFNGGDGIDTADYSSRIENLTIDLDGVADDGAVGEGDNVQTNVENVTGGRGNDRITGNELANLLKGGYGNDELRGGDGNDRLFGDNGDDTLYGGAHGDYLDGGANKDVLYGESGADTMFGGSGDDRLYGGDDNDQLTGGSGKDSMYGGKGADVFWAVDGETDFVDGGLDLDDDVAIIDAALDSMFSIP